MKHFNYKFTFSALIACLICAGATDAVAQIGPELRPPGLPEEHPIDSYSEVSKKHAVDDWRHEASWELNANDVVFSASKKRQLISEAPSTIHVITDRDIARHGWRNLAEILRHVPGVQTLTTDSQFQSVMIRGLVGTEDNNSRILWLQNGVPINDVRDSGIWIDDTYPIDLIKRIEVVLGPGSALYGSGAFQGVINIFTKDPKDIGKYGEYRVTFQNNMTFKASAIAAYNDDENDFGIMLHASANTTQGPGLIGDYVYNNYLMDTAANSIGSGKDAKSIRLERIDSNSDKTWYNINAKLNYKDFKLQLGFSDIYAGADGSEIVPNVAYESTHITDYTSPLPAGGIIDDEIIGENYRFNRREAYTDLIYETNFGDSVTFLSVLSYRFIQYNIENFNSLTLDDVSDVRIVDPQGNQLDISLTDFQSHGYDDKINFDAFQHKLYALAQAQWRIYDANELIGGLVMEYNYITTPEFGLDKVDNTRDGSLLDTTTTSTEIGFITPSVFLQDEQRFWNDRMILTAGGRIDFYKANLDSHKIAPSWRLAFLAKWTDWLTMRVSYGYAFKEPSLYQLNVDMYDYVGNPNLTNESLHNVELSLVFMPFYFLTVRLDGFATFMSDLIRLEYLTTSSPNTASYMSDRWMGELGKYHPVQDSDANIFGFEVSTNAKLSSNWDIYAHYNFLYSKRIYDDNTKENIVDDAMHRLKVGFSYSNEYLTSDLAAFLVSESPEIDSVSTPLYAIIQPAVTVRLPANLGLTLQGSMAFSENMLSSPTYRYYYEADRIPVSRYSFMFSLLYPFRNETDL